MMRPVFLYLDPGSGSYLVQAIIAGILGVLFYFKRIWLWVRSLFIRPSKNKQPPNQPS